MKSTVLLKVVIVWAVMFVLAACTALRPAGADTSRTSIRITSPANNTVLSTGSVITIHGSAYISRSLGGAGLDGAEYVEFFVNGTSIGSGERTAWRDDQFHDWTAPRAGEYLIQGVATSPEGTRIISNPVRVCVVDFAGLPTDALGVSLENTLVYPTYSCNPPPLPTYTRPEETQAPTLESFGSDLFGGSLGCFDDRFADRYRRITLFAVVHDPSLVVDYGLFSLPTIGRVFSYGSGAPERSYGADFLVPPDFSGSYTFQALSGGGIVLERTLGMPTESCDEALARGAAVPTPTATTAPSALTCPAGTYFAEVTNKCVPIAVAPTKKGGGNACALSDAACAPNKFDPATCTCY